MNVPTDQLEELRPLCDGISAYSEGGLNYLLLEQLRLPDGCSPARTDALLCLDPRDGYPTRLFLASRVTGRNTPNWNANVRVIERNWHAYSWKPETPELRLAQTVLNHLRGLN